MPIRFLSVDIMRGDIFLAAAFVIFGDRSAHRKFMEFSRPGGKAGLVLLFGLGNDDGVGIEERRPLLVPVVAFQSGLGADFLHFVRAAVGHLVFKPNEFPSRVF
jgi:hypothetical protein